MSGSSSLRPEALAAFAVLALAAAASAGPADVVKAEASCEGERCRFAVTIRHADAGWNHYADRFEVLDADGRILATRVLRHPHVHEQPFTRELQGAKIPQDITRVRIRAHDSRHGDGGESVVLELTR